MIDKNNENYYELFNILYTYLSKERNLNLSVSANSFQAESTSNAVAMASSDEYLDNYKSPTYSEYVDKTDDDIVKIIPKDYFFIVGVKSYYGKEFYVYIDTYNTWYNHIPIYVSQVYIVDIDVTKSNSTQDSLLDFNASGYPNIESNCGVYIEPVINEIYIGVKAENNDSFNISQVQNKTVLRNDNLKLNIGYRATPKYIVLDNFGVINDYADEKDKYNCIYHVKYRMEINKEGVKPNNISDMICSYIGTFIDICSILGIPIISDILSVFSTYWGLVDDYLTSNTGKAEYKIKQEQPKLIGENIAYFYNSLNADSVLFHMINFLDSLRERNALDYKYIIEIKNSSYNGEKDGVSALDDALISPAYRQTYLKFSFYIFDDNYRLTNSDVVFDYDFYDYNYSVNYTGNIFQNEQFMISNLSSKSTISFNIVKNNFEYVYLISNNVSGTFLYNIPQNTYLKLVDINGRTLYSSNSRHGKLNHLLFNIEANKQYFLVGGYYDSAKTGTFIVNKTNIGQFTYPNYMSYSYSAHNLPSIKCLSYQHYGVYKIYTITTDSYCDTEIFIYNDKCGLIGYDDNSLYQDEDVSNYNASLYEPIGDDELVYIVCRTKTIYYNNNVELSLIKWS